MSFMMANQLESYTSINVLIKAFQSGIIVFNSFTKATISPRKQWKFWQGFEKILKFFQNPGYSCQASEFWVPLGFLMVLNPFPPSGK